MDAKSVGSSRDMSSSTVSPSVASSWSSDSDIKSSGVNAAASIRFSAALKQAESISIPKKRLSSCKAATPDEPTPMKGSKTKSPGFVANLTK